jgi:endonuclease-8
VPEGDTLHRTATRLRAALEGRTVTRFESPRLVGHRPRPGDVIAVVEAVGKNLLIHFDRGTEREPTGPRSRSSLVLQTHMMMTGSWHIYRTNERWQRPAHQMRVRIDVDGWVAVCFAAPVVRTYVEGAASTPVDHLGPDLCRDDADLGDALARMAGIPEPDTTIAEVLLDQRVAAGVGNVYKSETLFACRLDPFTPLSAVGDDLRRRLLETASRQLRANLGSGPRTTVPGGLAVYGRQRRPCRACGTPIRMRHHGAQQRSTYWCPNCQRPPAL